MRLRTALVVVALASGCKQDTPSPSPPPPPADPNAEKYAALYDRARDGNLGSMELYYSQLPEAERAKKAAPQLAPSVLNGWDKISQDARKTAQDTGVDRARGKDNRLGLADQIRMLDELSSQAPDLAAKWAPLKVELTSLEQAAYTSEHDDKRPRVIVWTPVSEHASPNEMLGADVIDCVLAAIEKKWPAFKFVPEYHQVGGPSLEIAVLSKNDEYRSTTGKTMRLAAGGELALRPHELTGPLGKAFATELVATASVQNPTEIKSDIGVTPTLEASQAGTRAIEATHDQLCDSIEKQIAAR